MIMTNQRSIARAQIEKLVRFFEQNIHQLKSQSFNETQARQQLIDPLFDALGWDVHNRGMKPLYLQEVVPEGRVKTNLTKEVKEQGVPLEKETTLGNIHREYASILDYIAEDNYKASAKEAIKKPDYRFRIKGQTKFFVEAKKPFVDISKSYEAIFQVKRYGFSGRVPVSILTDFEQFRTFDCTHKPQFDKPNVGIIKELDLTYPQYLDQFDILYDTFSREAVEAGSLDTLTRKLLKKKTGDFALDKHFLEDLSKWREELARDIAKHPINRRRLNDYTLNESVQRILDRIVFFRVCEDREIEVENTLLAILQMWQGRPGISLYSLLNDLFKQRRALYNGLLFAPHECEELEVGNDVLLKILEGLNYPFSPYYFNEIGVEILGSIYEKFLGKTIRLTPKTVRVEEKPEVRKAGGVYYTPQYIVNYIVENTVGKLIEGKSPRQIAKLKIIDIACGSGSFLLGAFQKLIDYHIEWYTKHPKDIQTVNGVADAYRDAEGNLHLSPRKKRDILLNNIYGVDIDRQAVEVTQMSLYLKVLEGENAETLNPQMTLALKEVYLPELTDNIKCGNSLIGTDFLAQADLFDEETRRKVNPFDWEMEFPFLTPSQSPPLQGGDVPTQVGTEGIGGFDCVIGNPPYILLQDDFGVPAQIEYIKKKYTVASYKIDTYHLFIEKAVSILCKNGLVGYIVPSNFLTNNYLVPLRRFILENTEMNEINTLIGSVFQGVSVNSAVFVFRKDAGRISGKTAILRTCSASSNLMEIKTEQKFAQAELLNSKELLFKFSHDSKLLSKIDNVSHELRQFASVSFGMQLRDRTIYLMDVVVATTKSQRDKLSKKYRECLTGKDVGRYMISYSDLFCLEDIVAKRGGCWDLEIHHTKDKIIIRQIGEFPICGLDEVGRNCLNTVFMVVPQDATNTRFILGILNSRLVQFYWTQRFYDQRETFPKIKGSYLKQLPIRTIDFTNPEEKQVHDSLVALVDKMLELHKQLNKVTFDSEKEPIHRQIAATDKKIDQLVYQLYNITEEEKTIIEGTDTK